MSHTFNSIGTISIGYFYVSSRKIDCNKFDFGNLICSVYWGGSNVHHLKCYNGAGVVHFIDCTKLF